MTAEAGLADEGVVKSVVSLTLTMMATVTSHSSDLLSAKKMPVVTSLHTKTMVMEPSPVATMCFHSVAAKPRHAFDHGRLQQRRNVDIYIGFPTVTSQVVSLTVAVQTGWLLREFGSTTVAGASLKPKTVLSSKTTMSMRTLLCLLISMAMAG